MKNEDPYSNRELDSKFGAVHEKLDLILAQTSRHNGRMTKLEAWRNYIAGGIAALTLVGAPTIYYVFILPLQAIETKTDNIIARFPEGMSMSFAKSK